MADLSGFFGGLTQVASTVLPILGQSGVFGGPQQSPFPQQMPMPRTLPGGAMATPAGFELPFIDIAPGGIMSGQGGTCIQPRTRAATGYPGTVQFMASTPSGNTRVMTYKNKGRALLYSDDLAACKRVKRVATRARRAAGGR